VNNRLQLKLRITAENFNDPDVRDLLYEAYDYQSQLNREKELKKSYWELTSSVEAEVAGAMDATFAEHRLPRFKTRFLAHYQGTQGEKLIYAARQLAHGFLPEQPRILLEVIAPLFFNDFPHAEVWFLELDENTRSEIWQSENRLHRQLKLNQQQTYDPEYDAGSPHEASGLEGGMSAYLWLRLMTFCFYPYVNGDFATSDGRLFFLLLPDRAIDSRAEYRFDLHREAEFYLNDIYSDSVFPARRGKSFAPDTTSLLSNTAPYFEWYIDRCNSLLDQLLGINDLKKRFILTLTLNRLAFDCWIIEVSEVPYLMKQLFFGVLDKYANLYVQTELESKRKEVEIWKKSLTNDFYESTIKPSIQGIPGSAGDYIRYSAAWIYGNLAHNGPSPDIMRELRNSYHGYGIQHIDSLLSHSGELSNDVPSLSNILWHSLLSAGLPIKTCL